MDGIHGPVYGWQRQGRWQRRGWAALCLRMMQQNVKLRWRRRSALRNIRDQLIARYRDKEVVRTWLEKRWRRRNALNVREYEIN